MPFTFVPEDGKAEQIQSKTDLSRAESIRNAATRGLIKGSAEASHISPTNLGPIPFEAGMRAVQQMLPSNKGRPEEIAERAGKIVPYVIGGPETALSKLFRLATSVVGGETAKELGFGEKGQAVAEALGTLRTKDLFPKGAPRIAQPRAATKNIAPSKMGFVTPETFNKKLLQIDEQAAELAGQVGKEHPLFSKVSGAIKKGEPIQQRFNKVFDALENTAKEFNPEINVAPLDEFLKKETQLYEKTGSPTGLGRFVTGEIEGWKKYGSPHLYNLYRRYRLNNERIGELYKELPSGESRNKMINFLTRMNDSIQASMKSSLGQGSKAIVPQGEKAAMSPANLWIKAFEESNAGYSAWKKTEQVNSILNPILEKNLTNQKLSALIGSSRKWENIEHFLGKEEAGKLKGVLTDMQKARDGLSKIKQQNLGPAIIKAVLLQKVPGIGTLSKFLSLPTLWNWVKGHYYSSPEFAKNFHEFTQAITEGNALAISKAIKQFEPEKKKEEKSKVTFVED